MVLSPRNEIQFYFFIESFDKTFFYTNQNLTYTDVLIDNFMMKIIFSRLHLNSLDPTDQILYYRNRTFSWRYTCESAMTDRLKSSVTRLSLIGEVIVSRERGLREWIDLKTATTCLSCIFVFVYRFVERHTCGAGLCPIVRVRHLLKSVEKDIIRKTVESTCILYDRWHLKNCI